MDPKDPNSEGLQAKDPNGVKPKKGKAPGKESNTDAYGYGGTGTQSKTPGKQSGTEHLPDGPNGDNGNPANADKSVGSPNVAQPQVPDGKETKAVGPTVGKKTAVPAAANGNQPAGETPKKKPASSAADHKLQVPNADTKQAVPLQPKAQEPAKILDVPTVVAPTAVVVTPPVGGKIDESHQALRAEVETINAAIKGNHDDILATSKQLAQSVTAQLTAHAATVDQLIVTGTQRVGAAYDSVTKAVTDAAQNANEEIGKREASIPAAIKAAKDKKAAEIKATVEKTKTDVTNAVTKGAKAEAAKKTAVAFADKVDAKGVELAATVDNTMGPKGPLAKDLNPKKYSAQIQNQTGRAAYQTGLQALAEDKRLSLITSAGKDAKKFLDSALKPLANKYRTQSNIIVDAALKEAAANLDAAIKVHEPEQQKNLDAAATLATSALQKHVDMTRSGLTGAQKQATTTINADRKEAEDGAKKAGTQLSENIKTGAKELENKLSKKAAQDAAGYAKAKESLQQLAKNKKLTPETKAEFAALLTQLNTAHAENKKTLEELATTGVTELKSTKAAEYEKAIVGYEQSAGKIRGELVQKVTGATVDLGKSFDTIGTSFDSTVTSEKAKLDVELKFYVKQAEELPDTYGTKLDKILKDVTSGLQLGLDKMLEPAKIQETLNKNSEPEIKKVMKTAPADAQSIWAAMDGAGTDENAIYAVLRKATPGEIIFIEGVYNDAYPKRGTSKYPSPLRADLDDELSGSEWDIAFSYLRHEREKALRMELDDSRGFFNDDEDRMEQVLKAASDDELKNILSSKEGQETLARVKGCLSGCDLDVVNALTATDDKGLPLADRKIKADSIRIYDAMYGGLTGAGTDEAKIKAILEATTDPAERKKLHDYYAAYIAKKDPMQAAILRQQSGANADLLDASLDDEMSGGELTYTRALAEHQMSQEDHAKLVQMAKLVDGAQGSGTDEDKMIEALDDEEYAKAYKAEKDPAKQDEMAKKREAALNARLKWLEGSRVGEDGKPMKGAPTKNADGTASEGAELKSGPDIQAKGIGGDFNGNSITDIIKGESGTENITFQEILRGVYAEDRGTKKKGDPVDKASLQMRARNGTLNLEYMVMQRKLQAGFCDPELLIAYACWGVSGTDEANLKKGLKNGGELRPQTGAESIDELRNKFKAAWGVDLYNGINEIQRMDFKEPSGIVPGEVSGKDWLEIRIALMGKPQTPDQVGYVDNVRHKFVTSGTGNASPFSHSREDMEVNHERLQAEVAKHKGEKDLSSFEMTEEEKKKAQKDSSSALYLEENRLVTLAEYAEKSEMAFLEAKEAVADAVIMVIELIGAALITAASMGAGSPMLVAFIGNLILSGMTILIRKDMVGDAYGSEEIGIDVVKGIVMAAVAAAGEAKVLADFSKKAGQVGGKMLGAFTGGVEKGGMKVVDEGIAVGTKAAAKLEAKVGTGVAKQAAGAADNVAAKEALSTADNVIAKEAASTADNVAASTADNVAGTAATQGDNIAAAAAKQGSKVEATIAAGTKNAANAAMSETAQFLTDEKTYDMKGWEALFGENSIGARLLKKIPSAFAQGAFTDYIQNIAGVSTLEHAGRIKSGSEEIFRNIIAQVAGDTVGFFTYLDNYADAGTFWLELLKGTGKSIGSGGLTGLAMHKTRAKKLAKDLADAIKSGEGLEDAWANIHLASKYMKSDELQLLADHYAKQGTPTDDLPANIKALIGKQAKAGGSVTEDGGDTQKPPAVEEKKAPGDEKKPIVDEKKPVVEEKKPVVEEKKPVAEEKKPVDEKAPVEEKKPAPVKKPDPVEEKVDPETAKKVAASEEKEVHKTPTEVEPKKAAVKPAETVDPKIAAEEAQKVARQERIKEQKEEKGHAGIEVHSHFLGNVDPKTFRSVITDSGLAPMKAGDVTSWEPVLREIIALEKKPGFGHTYKKNAAGDLEIDPQTNKPIIETRGNTGDAIAQAKEALKRIEALKEQLATPGLKPKEIESLKDKIYREARSASEKALRASDETDFNSSYEVRDEFIKKFYGEADSKKILGETSGEKFTDEVAAKYKKHFEENNRPEVVKKVSDALEAQKQLDANPNMPEKDKAKLQSKIDSVKEQLGYDRYAKDTILRLVEDGLTYTEQSNSAKKLAERFDPDQIAQVKAQLIKERPDLKDKIEAFEVKHLAMLNTASFGIRGNEDGTVDTSDIHAAQKGTRAKPKTEAERIQEEQDFKAGVKKVVDQTKRGDVVGVDIAGAEHFTFDAEGAKRFGFLYDELYKAAVERGKTIVLRPHVGEGANDMVAGKHNARDMDRQMEDGKPSHYKRAKDNLDALLTTLEAVAANKGKDGKLPPEVIVRFGHATHATPQQAARMAKLGIIAEVNLSSNHETGSVSQKKTKSDTQDNQRDKDTQFPKKNVSQDRGGKLQDHSLANLILNDVDVILSTDGHSVMSTTMKREYELAQKQIKKILDGKQKIPLTLEQAEALGVKKSLLKKVDGDGVVHVKITDIPEANRGPIVKKFEEAHHKFYESANKYYDNRPKQDNAPDEGGPSVPPTETEHKNVKAPKKASEVEDGQNIGAATDIMKEKFAAETADVKLVGPPKGKPVLLQSASEALISLPVDTIPPGSTFGEALANFLKKGIPRWGQLTEKERMHETAFANRMEREMPQQIEAFMKMSQSSDDKETFQFEVDKAKQLYARYGKGSDLSKVTDDQAETRATANHALHPTAVALARLAFLKRLDEMAALPKDHPHRNVFVTNGGCGAGKGSLFGLAGDAMPGKKFGAVWDAAGEGDAGENGWILQAAMKRGLNVSYAFAENDAASNYKGVLDRAEATGRIVDPITYQRSYVRGQQAMKDFLSSKEYLDALASGKVEAIGLNIPELRAEQARHKKALETDPKAEKNKDAGKMGKDGRITADDIKTEADNPDLNEKKVTEQAAQIFKEWVDKKREEYKNDPKKLQQLEWFVEGGATNTMKFQQAPDVNADPQVVQKRLDADLEGAPLGRASSSEHTESQKIQRPTRENRQGVPDNVPVDGEEVRAYISKAFKEVVEKYAHNLTNKTKAQSAESDPYKPLLDELRALKPGELATDRDRAKEIIAKFTALSKKLAAEEKATAGTNTREQESNDLRDLYTNFEEFHMKPMLVSLKEQHKLSPDIVATMAHMMREEAKVFTRDLMSSESATEALYLRDRAVYGYRRGPSFDEYLAELIHQVGSEEAAKEELVKKATESNKDVNAAFKSKKQ